MKSCTVLFLLGAWTLFAQPVAAQPHTLTGWFTFIVADSPSEAGFTSEITYILTEDSGERHELLLDIDLMRPLGGPVALNRQRVTVVGEWEADGTDAPAQFRVSAIHLDPPQDELTTPEGAYRALQATSQTAVTGSQAWVTILCRFADVTDVTPHPVSFYEKMTRASYPALGHYWNEVSDGNVPDFAGSVVVGWYNLPRPYSYYRTVLEDGRESLETDRAARDCTAVADADVFFPDFDGINLAFNHSDSDTAASRGGSERLTLDGQTRFWGVTWMTPVNQLEQHVWAHEMGHGFGLLHSSGPYDETYDSYWDVMGGWPPTLFSHPEYGDVPIHTIAYHKDFLGWIPPARKYVAAPNTTQTIALERLAQPGAEGYLMAQIPIGDSTTDFYTVEARLFAGYDEEIPDEAVVIHKVDTTLEDRLAQVVDVDNNGDPNDEGAMWTVGEIFTDVENNLQVSIDAAWSTSYRVTINTDPATFSTCIDFLSSSSHLFGPGRDQASVQVKAASDCDWSARSNTEWIRVTSGAGSSGSGRVSYTVTRNPRSSARTGTLTIGGWTFTVTQAGANEVLFEDDMEDGTNDWDGFAPWTLTTASSQSGTSAWKWQHQGESNTPLWSPVIDLTGVEWATLTFWHRFNFTGDGMSHVWVAPQNEQPGTEIKRFIFGDTQDWTQVSLDLSPFVGQAIKIAFNVFDATNTKDFWYIDDVAVLSSDPVASAEVRSGFESPQAGPVSGIGVIQGWAFAEQAGVGISRVDLVIDGAVVGDIPCCSERGDVAGAFPQFPAENTRHSGWGLTYNWGLLSAGAHTVQVKLHTTEGAVVPTAVRTIDVVKPGGFAYLDRFALSEAAVALEGQELVVSGVVVRDKATQQERQVVTRFRWQGSRQGLSLVGAETGTTLAAGASSWGELLAALPVRLLGWLTPTETQAAPGLVATFEGPKAGQPVSGIGVINGWAFAEGAGETIQAVRLVVDGQAWGTIPCCSTRGDVAGHFPALPQALHSGWGLTFNYGLLPSGPHTFEVQLEASGGVVRSLTHPVSVVRLGEFAFLDQFDLSGATVRREAEEVVLAGVRIRDKASQQSKRVTVRLRWFEGRQGLGIVAAHDEVPVSAALE